jgi:hypothetical protein
VQIRRSKTDQEGEEQEIAIPRGYRLRLGQAILAAALVAIPRSRSSLNSTVRPASPFSRRWRAFPNEPPAIAEQARTAAVKELLDRGFGKATQMISGDTNTPLIVEFSWASDPTAQPLPSPVIETVVEQIEVDDEVEVTWQTAEAVD